MKSKQKLKQNGSHIIFIVLIVVVVCVLGFGAYMIFGSKNSKYGYAWDFDPNNNTWHAVDSTPQCPSQILAMSPVDVTLASTILWPGQYRGTNYKPHGGFLFSDIKTGEVTVKLPMDAYLVGATKYQQTGDSGKSDTQYLLTFENPCGYAVMFDHLYEITAEFTAIANKGATTGESNTESRFLDKAEKKFYKAGTVLATKTGFVKDGSTMLDFGVYDLRQQNEISKNADWANIHRIFASQSFYGVCWIDLLPTADKEKVMKILPTAKDDKGASDYCGFAPGGDTLKYNRGKPVASGSNTN